MEIIAGDSGRKPPPTSDDTTDGSGVPNDQPWPKHERQERWISISFGDRELSKTRPAIAPAKNRKLPARECACVRAHGLGRKRAVWWSVIRIITIRTIPHGRQPATVYRRGAA